MSTRVEVLGCYAIQQLRLGDWQIEVWDEGGKVIDVGAHKGKLTKSGWKKMESFHPSRVQALEKILRLMNKDRLPETIQLEDVISEYKQLADILVKDLARALCHD